MHKYPFLYQQCESTIGYDDMIERLGKDRILLMLLDTNCMMNSDTVVSKIIALQLYSELIDFLDGNGFIIKYINNMIRIIPIERKNI